MALLWLLVGIVVLFVLLISLLIAGWIYDVGFRAGRQQGLTEIHLKIVEQLQKDAEEAVKD